VDSLLLDHDSHSVQQVWRNVLERKERKTIMFQMPSFSEDWPDAGNAEWKHNYESVHRFHEENKSLFQLSDELNYMNHFSTTKWPKETAKMIWKYL